MLNLRGLHRELPCDSAIPLPGAHPREPRACGHTETCARMLTAASSATGNMWKQPECLISRQTDARNAASAHRGKYYSAIKRNTVPTHPATWMDLEIILSETSQSKRPRITWFPSPAVSGTGEATETGSALAVAQGRRGENQGTAEWGSSRSDQIP